MLPKLGEAGPKIDFFLDGDYIDEKKTNLTAFYYTGVYILEPSNAKKFTTHKFTENATAIFPTTNSAKGENIRLKLSNKYKNNLQLADRFNRVFKMMKDDAENVSETAFPIINPKEKMANQSSNGISPADFEKLVSLILNLNLPNGIREQAVD